MRSPRAGRRPPLLARLASLNLACNGLDDRCVGLLAGSPHAAGLRVLRLGHNYVAEEGVRALVESPYLAGLVGLDLSDDWLGAESKWDLLSRFGRSDRKF